MANAVVPDEIILDPNIRGTEVQEFEQQLQHLIVGQDQAVKQIVNLFQVIKAGLVAPGRPIGNLLFLGPTGSGKTRVVEASAAILFGSSSSLIKIDCAEYQYGHEIARLIGSPPGYVGHRETSPLLSQDAIDRHQTERNRFTFLLFDEIEKASDVLWQLLLGVLDKGSLTLGDNHRVDLSRCVIIMTSNLGAAEMSRLLSTSIGFGKGREDSDAELMDLDQRIYRTAVEVASRRFSPEFMNRIDKIVVFRTLTAEDLQRVFEIEFAEVQNRILSVQSDRQFVIHCAQAAKDFVIREGMDRKYGARHLKRAIERHLVHPISNLVASGQIGQGDVVRIDVSRDGAQIVFVRECVSVTLGAPENGTPSPVVPVVSPIKGAESISTASLEEWECV